jgi:hypothetical protein
MPYIYPTDLVENSHHKTASKGIGQRHPGRDAMFAFLALIAVRPGEIALFQDVVYATMNIFDVIPRIADLLDYHGVLPSDKS